MKLEIFLINSHFFLNPPPYFQNKASEEATFHFLVAFVKVKRR